MKHGNTQSCGKHYLHRPKRNIDSRKHATSGSCRVDGKLVGKSTKESERRSERNA